MPPRRPDPRGPDSVAAVLRALDSERAIIDGMINTASKSLSAGVAPPSLPS